MLFTVRFGPFHISELQPLVIEQKSTDSIIYSCLLCAVVFYFLFACLHFKVFPWQRSDAGIISYWIRILSKH